MRPIQLIMTAFGPYKQKEIIDFENLENIVFSLFLGIQELENNDFDAICYVLYGEASGERT